MRFQRFKLHGRSWSRPTNPASEILGHSGNIKIIRPAPAAIPFSEGIHLQVVDGQNQSWRQREIKDILRMEFFALPAAKVIAEGKFSPDLWANIHLNSYPGFDNGVNVFGRNPKSGTGWGKPVVIRYINAEPLEEEMKKKLTTTLDHYLPTWKKLLPKIQLSKNGIGQIDPQDPDFVVEEEKLAGKNEKTIWANEKFILVIVGNPHLSGLHLVVHTRESYWKKRGGFQRPWHVNPNGPEAPENVEGYLEAVSIIFGAEKILLEEEGLAFYNPEIHFSGNWAADLVIAESGGKLNLDYYSMENLERARKAGKRIYKAGAEDELQTAMHGHLYATRDPKTFVKLPTRPQQEVPNQWEGITPLSVDETTRISQVISKRLTPWLEKNASGKIYAKLSL